MKLDIKKAITSRGIEVREVAARMGISAVSMSNHINGNPSVNILKRIAEAIPCKVSEFFVEEDGAQEENIIVCPNCGTRMIVKKEETHESK